MAVVVIGGPIASGKSALGRAVASLIEGTRELSTPVIDLDLVYEMLDPRRRPKDDACLWRDARRVAGRIAGVLLDEARYVIAEGDFATATALAEFERELPGSIEVLLVMLEVDFETALERASADESRGVSKDREFLSGHYEAFQHGWSDREVLHIDTARIRLTDAARFVVDALNPPR